MGQYYKGNKIGTCSSMYYLRQDQAEELALQGEKDDDGIKFDDYLKDESTHFRFPFPDEDGLTLSEMAGLAHDRVWTVGVGDFPLLHKNKTVNVSGVNVFLPCVHSNEFRALGIGHSYIGEQKIGIRYTSNIDGNRAFLFECTVCGCLQLCEREELEALKVEILEYIDRHGSEEYRANHPEAQKEYQEEMEMFARL